MIEFEKVGRFVKDEGDKTTVSGIQAIGSSVGTAVGIRVGCDDGSSVGTCVGIGVG